MYRVNKFEVQKYEPKVEIQHIGFRRVLTPYPSVRIQLIRCTEDHAIIPSGRDGSAYLLEKYVPIYELGQSISDDPLHPLFVIHSLFVYEKRDGTEAMKNE